MNTEVFWRGAATALLAAGLTSPAAAQRTHARNSPTPPKSIGKFDDWQAATHIEAGQQVCYAFVRAAGSSPALPGRGDVVLTVTQRPGSRDAVAISAGFTYASGAEVFVGVDGASMPFYTANRSAFARDGRATVAAFHKGRQAVAKSPGPRNTPVSDTFNLRGFTQAYTAINRACAVR